MGRSAGFVNKYQLGRIEGGLRLLPIGVRLPNIRSRLSVWQHDTFLKLS